MKTNGKIKDFHVYLPLDLAKKLSEVAEKENRSTQRQIRYILQLWLDGYAEGDAIARRSMRAR